MAHAQDESETVRIEYDAPPGCPTKDRFFSELSARTKLIRIAPDGDSARLFRVSLESKANSIEGVLTTVDAGERSEPRKVTSATCEEVMRALSLMIALSVDPKAKAEPPSVVPPTILPAPEVVEPVRTPIASESWIVNGGGGASLTLLSITTPTSLAALGVYAEIGWNRVRGNERERIGILEPVVRLGLSRTFTSTRDAGPGKIDLQWTFGTLDFCPIHFPLNEKQRGFTLRPCVQGAIGEVDARGYGVTTEYSRGRMWAHAGALLRGEIHVSFLALELSGGVAAPFSRDSFVFLPEPAVSAYRAPPAFVFGSFAVGVHFP